MPVHLIHKCIEFKNVFSHPVYKSNKLLKSLILTASVSPSAPSQLMALTVAS